MKPKFEVQVTEFKTLKELEGSWKTLDYKAILALCDFDGINQIDDSELYDYLALYLSDLEPEESAEILLSYKLGDKLNAGQIQEIAHTMVDDPIWEEYQDISLHEDLFKVSSLLYKIYNGKFPKPSAVKAVLEIVPDNQKSEEILKDISSSFLCRLLADGMNSHSVLIRLFVKNLLGKSFLESEHIIWDYKVVSQLQERTTVEIITSYYWIDELQHTSTFTTHAYNDELVDLPV